VLKLRPAFAALAVTACASPPPPAPVSDQLAERFMQLNRSTQWRLVSETRIPFDTHHPQGMVRLNGDIFFTSVEIIRPTQRYTQPVNGLDRDAGEGRGHLFRIAADGSLKSDIPLGESDIYHPGGLDFDGRYLWIPVAEYRPDSRSIIYRVDPATLEVTEAFRVPDHIGAVAVDREAHALIGVSWGGARLYRWPLQPDGAVAPADLSAPPAGKARAHFIAWQDCHGLSSGPMLCTGLSNYARPGGPSLSLGGAELIGLSDLRPLWQTPIQLWSPTGRSMLQNPAWFEATPDGLRAWFIPDDDTSTLFTYEVALPAN
jgi:hypothetical protein